MEKKSMTTDEVLNNDEIPEIVKLVALVAESGGVPYLSGGPGIGKTSMIRNLAEITGRHLEIKLGSQMEPSDFGIPVISEKDGTVPVINTTTPDWIIANNERKGKTIIFLDEITATSDSVQNAMLTFVQDRRLPNGVELDPNTWIIMAGNPTEQVVGGYELGAPMSNRLNHFTINVDVDEWLTKMPSNWGHELTGKYEAETRATIAAFISRNRDILYRYPDDTTDVAWPSPRSWDNAAKQIGRVGVNSPLAPALMKSTVGDEAFLMFSTFYMNRKLPSPIDVVKNPNSVKWEEFESDAIWSILEPVARLSLPNVKEAEMLEKITQVFESIIKRGAKDSAVSTSTGVIHTTLAPRLRLFANKGTEEAKIRRDLIRRLTKGREDVLNDRLVAKKQK